MIILTPNSQYTFQGRDDSTSDHLVIKEQARFMAKVNVLGECWNWIGATSSSGHGSHRQGNFYLRGSTWLANRASYELFVGPIPLGMQIDHQCHNTLCVRPEHLRPVTQKQNQENRRGASSPSGIRGVDLFRNGKWRGRVHHNKKLYHVGYFDTAEQANAAVVAKRNELFTHNDRDRHAHPHS